MAGLGENGFTSKTLEAIAGEILTDVASELEVPTSRLGRVIRRLSLAFARPLHRVWQLLQLVADLYQPRNASSTLLDHLADLAGLTREPATKARVQITVEGDVGVFLAAGKLIRRDGTTDDFALVSEHTIASLAVDNALIFEAVVAGALIIEDEDTFSIQTPVSGWTGVTDPLKLTDGRDAETDEALRLRRERAVSAPRSSHEAAIRRELLALEQVEECVVISNRTSATSLGIHPNAIVAIIYPPGLSDEDAQGVAETLFRTAPAGIELQGTESFDIVDEQGYTQTIGWLYATVFPVWLKADLTVDASRWPVDGASKVQAALEEAIAGYTITVKTTVVQIVQLEAAARCAAPGILGATLYFGGEDPPTASDDISLITGVRMVLQGVTVEVTPS